MDAATLKDRALAFAQQAVAALPAPEKQALTPLHEPGQNRLSALTFPGRKTENWKYTSLNPLPETLLTVESASEEPATTASPLLENCDVIQLVNGHYQAEASRLDSRIQLTSLSDTRPEKLEQIARTFNALEGNAFPFAALLQASVIQGLVVTLPANTRLERPLYFCQQFSGLQPCQFLLVIDVPQGTEAEIIEHSTGHCDNRLMNTATLISTAENSQLEHLAIQREDEQALRVHLQHIRQQGNSRVNSIQLMTGCQLRRNDFRCHLEAPGAELGIHGVYLTAGSQHVDNQLCVEHQAPHCNSEENWKGILADQSTAVFNGRIHIHPGAARTQAELSNRNLLLSKRATINTKPELEIYNDDVKCAHGTTVGQLDHAALFYLQSRGIARQEAELMLSFGFINELLASINDAPLVEALQQSLGDYLKAQMQGNLQ